MNFVAAKCPNCGAEIQVDKNLETAFCLYCGSRVLVQDAVNRVRVVGPVEIRGTVKTVNNEFESKLANANNWAKIYFARGPKFVKYGNIVGYDAVVKYYSEAELAGANESKYYVYFSRFYIRANLLGFRDKTRILKSRKEFINGYTFLMDTAIELYEGDKKELITEKESTIDMLNVELKKYREHKFGCYVATAVYGSYNCPEVWTLRRYRDNTLAKTWYGRAFIHLYYAISPTLVRRFGNKTWFRRLWKARLDLFVERLNAMGVENTPYKDKIW